MNDENTNFEYYTITSRRILKALKHESFSQARYNQIHTECKQILDCLAFWT